MKSIYRTSILHRLTFSFINKEKCLKQFSNTEVASNNTITMIIIPRLISSVSDFTLENEIVPNFFEMVDNNLINNFNMNE